MDDSRRTNSQQSKFTIGRGNIYNIINTGQDTTADQQSQHPSEPQSQQNIKPAQI